MPRIVCGALLAAACMFVSTDLLAAGVQGCPPGQRVRGDLVQLDGTGINVRNGPGKDFDRVSGPDGTAFVADRSMQARALCRVDDWVLAEIIVGGGASRQAGWLLARFVDGVTAAATPEPSAEPRAQMRPVAQRCNTEARSGGPRHSPLGDRINVRSAPGTTAARVAGADGKEPLQLDTDSKVRVLCTEDDWSFIRVVDAPRLLEGWVQADLLGPPEFAPATTAESIQRCMASGTPAARRVATDDVNVRTGPGRDFARVLGRTGPVLLKADQDVDIQCSEGDWVRVALPDLPAASGWVLADYLQGGDTPPVAEASSVARVEPPAAIEPPPVSEPVQAVDPAVVTEPLRADPLDTALSDHADIPVVEEAAIEPTPPPAPAPAVKDEAVAAAEARTTDVVAKPAAVEAQPPPAGPCGPGGTPEPYLVGAMGSILETILMVSCKDKPGPGWFVLESAWRKGEVTASAATAPIAEAVDMCEARAQQNSGKDAEIDFWGEKDLWITVFPDQKIRVTKTFKIVAGKDAPVQRKISCLIAREKVLEQQTVMLQ